MWLLREKGTAEGPIAHLAGSAQRSPRFSSFSTYLMFYDFFDPLKADFVNFTPLDADQSTPACFYKISFSYVWGLNILYLRLISTCVIESLLEIWLVYVVNFCLAYLVSSNVVTYIWLFLVLCIFILRVYPLFLCFCCNSYWYNNLVCWRLLPLIIVLFHLFILKSEIFSIQPERRGRE